MVLEDVIEFDYSNEPTKLNKILLNGNNVCMVGCQTPMNIQWSRDAVIETILSLNC